MGKVRAGGGGQSGSQTEKKDRKAESDGQMIGRAEIDWKLSPPTAR